jgi:flagellar M-ring protein FliF
LLALLVVGGGLFAFFAFFANKLSQPPMGLLYGELSATDSGQIVAKLEAQNVPYELRAGGTQIWVPTDRALRLRMGMAEAGLPRGGSVGYEIFDRNETLTATSFVQNLNLVRALEGELSRTVAALGTVAGARVHLVIPRRDLFAREKQEPSASVALRLRDNNRLPRAQVQAIQHLVAAAVPGLKPTKISVVDDRGNLLARGSAEGEDVSASAIATDDMRRTAEQALARKIEEQIERAVGSGRVRAEVALEMDYDRVVTSQENFDPDGQVVRSQQTVTETGDSSETTPNPGVSVGNNIPDGEQNSAAGGQSRSRNNRQEETINYEITKTTRNHVREGGVIKRLSASVIVDGVITTGSDGKRTYQPRNQQEMDQLRSLARAAIGFDEKRGDTLEVVNLAFAGTDLGNETIPEPGMLDLTKQDLMRLAELGVLLLVALLVILLVARPMISSVAKALTPPPAPAAQPALTDRSADQKALNAPDGNGAAVEDGTINLANVEGRVKQSSVKKVGEIIEKHPEEAVSIIRNWMYQEA